MIYQRRPLDARGASTYKRQGASRGGDPDQKVSAHVLRQIFTWWTGATIGARHQIRRGGVFVGEDEAGNRYFETRDKRWNYDGRNRRFVIYKGYPDASKVSSEWHGWLHHTFVEPPTREPLLRRPWERGHLPNLTGTVWAWRPRGSIARQGVRPAASGDYQPWTPG